MKIESKNKCTVKTLSIIQIKGKYFRLFINECKKVLTFLSEVLR